MIFKPLFWYTSDVGFAYALVPSVEGKSSLPGDKNAHTHQVTQCAADCCQVIKNTEYNIVHFSQCVGFTALPE